MSAPYDTAHARSSQVSRPALFRDERLDLVRGAAVVCMVQWHTVDSFASPETRAGWLGQLAVFFGGGAAPLFLALAGAGATLGWLTRGRRCRALVERGLEIWSIAIIFRIIEWALGGDGASSLSLIRVDVLNCIGLSLVIVAGALWAGRALPTRALGVVVLVVAAVFIGLAPWVVRTDFGLPPALAYYLGGPGHLSLFPLFGWTGIACLGAAFAAFGTPAPLLLGAYGVILAARILFPDLLQFAPLNHNVVFTLERTALALGLLALAPLFPAKRALLQLGKHSLLIYCVHIELVYGLWFHGKKATLGPLAVALAAAVLLLCMWLLSYVPSRITKWQSQS